MKTLISSIRIFVVLSILTGILYPLAMTAFSEAVFKKQADGSLIEVNGKIVGSQLLAQKTVDPKYFWPRPSAADYGTVSSGASNQGILSKTLADAVAGRQKDFGGADLNKIPADLLYASGSGLDPHISPAAARFQINRVATARNLSEAQKTALTALVEKSIEGPQYGIFGDPRVNVLVLNLALNKI